MRPIIQCITRIRDADLIATPEEGRITKWNDAKGFGFIKPRSGGPEIFVHIKAFGNRTHRPAVNDAVTYDVSQDSQGRSRAVNAVRPDKKRIGGSIKRFDAWLKMLPFLFVVIVALSVALTDLPPVVPAAYLLVSLVTFGIYASDRAAARMGHWRTSEKTLHLLALAGGWPGAMLAQRYLRHKSKKLSFRFSFWITVLLNCAGLVWLHTSEGHAFLGQVLRTMTER